MGRFMEAVMQRVEAAEKKPTPRTISTAGVKKVKKSNERKHGKAPHDNWVCQHLGGDKHCTDEYDCDHPDAKKIHAGS